MINIKELTNNENKQITGGASMSGALFEGIASIVDSITGLVTGIGGMVYAFSESGKDHIKSEITFGKNASISWDDSAGVTSNSYIPSVSASHNVEHTSKDAIEHHDIYSFH